MRGFKWSPDDVIRLAEHYVGSVSGPAPNAFRAWVRLGRRVRRLHPDQAFDLACHIVCRLPASYLGSFGGGALAHLVQYHGGAVIDWMEKEARRDRKFLDALSSVCLAAEEVNPFVLPRLQAATGDRIRVVTRVDRDAAYRDMLNRGLTSSSSRRARMAKKRSHVRPLELVRDGEPPPRGIH